MTDLEILLSKVKEVNVLNLSKDSTLVVKYNEYVPQDVIIRFHNMIKEILKCNVLSLPFDVEISVVEEE